MTLLPFEIYPYGSLEGLFRFACKTAEESVSSKRKKETGSLTSVGASKRQWCHTSPLAGILLQDFHAAQFPGPIASSNGIRPFVEYRQIEAASALLHDWPVNPLVDPGVVRLHGLETLPTVISTTYQQQAVEIASPSGTLGGGHVRNDHVAVYLLNRSWS